MFDAHVGKGRMQRRQHIAPLHGSSARRMADDAPNHAPGSPSHPHHRSGSVWIRVLLTGRRFVWAVTGYQRPYKETQKGWSVGRGSKQSPLAHSHAAAALQRCRSWQNVFFNCFWCSPPHLISWAPSRPPATRRSRRSRNPLLLDMFTCGGTRARRCWWRPPNVGPRLLQSLSRRCRGRCHRLPPARQTGDAEDRRVDGVRVPRSLLLPAVR